MKKEKGATQKPKKVKPGRLKRRENMMGYLFILPWLIGLLVLVIYPLVDSFRYSLNSIIMSPRGRIFKFVKFNNYRNIFMEDPAFITQLQDYLIETIIAVPVIVAVALIVAMMLNGKIKMRGFFRLIFFLPVIIASGPVMNQLTSQGAANIPMMNTTMITGLLKEYLPNVIATAVSSVFENIIMLLWYSGVQILIFLSALQKIDTSLYEAAKIDGGSGWECFWKITIPTIKPMMLLNAVYTVIFMSNTETNGIITLIQSRMFSSSASAGGYGYASAIAWVYSIIVTLIVILIAVLLMGRKDIYARRAKKYAREMKKQQRLAKKFRKRGERNAKQLAGKAAKRQKAEKAA